MLLHESSVRILLYGETCFSFFSIFSIFIDKIGSMAGDGTVQRMTEKKKINYDTNELTVHKIGLHTTERQQEKLTMFFFRKKACRRGMKKNVDQRAGPFKYGSRCCPSAKQLCCIIPKIYIYIGGF